MPNSSDQIPKQSSYPVYHSNNHTNDEHNSSLSRLSSVPAYINSMQSDVQAEASPSNTSVFKAISNFLSRIFTATKNFRVVKMFSDAFKGLMSYIKNFTKKDNVEPIIGTHALQDDSLFDENKDIIENWCFEELKSHEGYAERQSIISIALKFVLSMDKNTGQIIVDSSFNELDYSNITSFPLRMTFRGDLHLNNLQNLNYFPLITVLGDLHIENFNGQMLQQPITLAEGPFIVTGDFSIKDSNTFVSLPKFLFVYGNFNISNCANFTNWPDNFKCGQDISVINCYSCISVPNQIFEMGSLDDGETRNITIQISDKLFDNFEYLRKIKNYSLHEKIGSTTGVNFNIGYHSLEKPGDPLDYLNEKLLPICDILNNYSILKSSFISRFTRQEKIILSTFIDSVMLTADFAYNNLTRKNIARQVLTIFNALKNEKNKALILNIMNNDALGFSESVNSQIDEILTQISINSATESIYSTEDIKDIELKTIGRYLFLKEELFNILKNIQEKEIKYTVTDKDGNLENKTLSFNLKYEEDIQDACLFLRIKLNESEFSFPNLPKLLTDYTGIHKILGEIEDSAIEAIAEHLKESYNSKFSDFLNNWEPWQKTLRSK